DLASLQTKAVEDGDDYIIDGQKVWTTGAHFTNYIYLVARTDPEAPKHRGISEFFIEANLPGITIRPLIDITGEHHFNEVFFDGVRIPKKAMIGEKNKGFYQILNQLDYERSGMERLMAKMAIESLALRLLNVEGGVQVVSNKTELDDLRSFARFGAPRKRWAIHVRDVYSPDFLFRDEHVGFYEVLHEFSFLYTKANELYYVCTIFGREYAINMGGPQLDGYESWLIKNAQRSPLDGRDSDYVYV
ncbi:MAG: acyl-CoA dehydrogenase family protein, partial [Planctomycetes bacterium]|nr:acyl-CoA dehydrogenase family protein [Planctomycetota bacterium]